MHVLSLTLISRLDLHASGEITQKDVADFEQQWMLPVHSIQNVPGQVVDPNSELNEVAFLLNYMCEQLWRRDQMLVDKSDVKKM